MGCAQLWKLEFSWKLTQWKGSVKGASFLACPLPRPTFAREEELLFPGLSAAVLWKLVGTCGGVLGSEGL